MKSLYEIRISGSGGQGIITAGMVMGEAASVFDGKYVVQTQSYGPEARGGACKTELIISEQEICYPKPEQADILLTLSQQAYDLYHQAVKEDAVTVVDSSLVKFEPREGVYAFPITELAKEHTGIAVTANVVALGIICLITNVVSYNALERALLSRIPPGTEEVNKKALQLARTLDLLK